MFTLRCTRKLLRRLGAKPSSEVVEPSTVLGDWYANLLHLRPQQLVLAMNERTLAVRAGAGSADRLARGALPHRGGRPAHGPRCDERAARGGMAAMEPMAIGATASRAVLGCLNDAVFQLSHRRAPGVSLRDLGLQLADNIYSLTDYQKPRHRALELFGVTASGATVARRRLLH